MEARCPHCQTRSHVDASRVRQAVLCKRCGRKFAATAIMNAGKKSTNGDVPASVSASSAMPKMIGGFAVRQELGAGAFGAVYLAHDSKLDRQVVLKVPHPHTLGSPCAVQRFEREARAAAALRHPHIVPIYAAGFDGTYYYIASQFIPAGTGKPTVGRTLAGLIGEGTVDFRTSARIIRDLAEALDYAHGMGIVHRDVKPANVLLDVHGGAHLADFGLAHRQDSQDKLTQEGAVLGTPAYMAPEQAAGRKDEVLPASDQYSLGMVLYEMLCGEVAFRGQVGFVISQQINQEPEAPRKRRAEVPRDLETICLKALAKDPEKRYENCQELADDLRRFLDDEPIQARPLGPMERAWRRVRRNPAVAGLVLAVAFTLVTGASVATFFAVRANVNATRADLKAEEADRESHRATEQARRAKEAEGEAKEAAGRADRNAKDAKDAAELADRNAKDAKEAAERADRKAKEATEEAHRANVGRHGFLITAAWQAWQQHDVAAADAYLEEIRPEFQQTWEYRHVRDLCRRKAMPLMGHAGLVHSVAIGPDGKRIVSGSSDGTVKLWDAGTGQVLRTLKGETGAVYSVAISPDGKRIVSGDYKRSVTVWDAGTGKDLRTLKGHTDWVRSVAISSDGKRIVSGSWDRTVKVWDAATGKEMLTLKGHTGNVNCVAISRDGKRIVSGSGGAPDRSGRQLFGELKVWDANSGNVFRNLKGHSARVWSVAISPDGKRIVSGSDDRTVKLWDAGTGQELLTLTGAGRAVTFSPDGKRIVTGSDDRTVKLWDASTGQVLLTLKGHRVMVASVAVSPDGTRIVSGGGDLVELGEVRVWDAEASQELLTVKGAMSPFAYSTDGNQVVSAGMNNTVRVWDTGTGLVLRTLKGHTSLVKCVAISPDGKRIVSGSIDKTLKVWDAGTGQELLTLEGHIGGVLSVSYSPDGKRIVSGSMDTTVKVWDAGTGQRLHTLTGNTKPITSVAISPDGKRIVSAGMDNTVRVWDAGTGHDLRTLTGHTKPIMGMVISPDSKRIISGSFDSTVKVWDIDRVKDPRTLKGHTGLVWSVAMSPDAKRIVSGSTDKTVKVWDANTGQNLLTLKGHTSVVNSVAVSPDGKRIISGSAGATVKVWDAGTGQDLLTLKGHTNGVRSVAISPDGTRIVSGSGDKTIKVWQGPTADPTLR